MKAGILSLALAITACAPTADQIANNADMLADNLEAQADRLDARAGADQNIAPTDASSQWVYDESKDEMRGSTGKTASLAASNSIMLDFPYGETTPNLVIRRDPKHGFNIYVTSAGQLLCRSYQHDVISVKFDNGPVREWSCSEADAGSNEVIFFNSEKKLLAAIKSAKKMMVEINYFDNGRKQMTFPVAGLKW